MIKTIGALWKKSDDKSDKKYVLSGNLELEEGGEKIKIFVFPNTRKMAESHPDYRISAIEKEDESEPAKASKPKKSNIPDDLFNS